MKIERYFLWIVLRIYLVNSMGPAWLACRFPFASCPSVALAHTRKKFIFKWPDFGETMVIE